MINYSCLKYKKYRTPGVYLREIDNSNFVFEFIKEAAIDHIDVTITCKVVAV